MTNRKSTAHLMPIEYYWAQNLIANLINLVYAVVHFDNVVICKWNWNCLWMDGGMMMLTVGSGNRHMVWNERRETWTGEHIIKYKLWCTSLRLSQAKTGRIRLPQPFIHPSIHPSIPQAVWLIYEQNPICQVKVFDLLFIASERPGRKSHTQPPNQEI